MTMPCFSRNPRTPNSTPDDKSPEASYEYRQDEYLDRQIEIEENRWDAYQDELDRKKLDEVIQVSMDKGAENNSIAARFVNPHPELGCLYYDENNIRHWYSHCHELKLR